MSSQETRILDLFDEWDAARQNGKDLTPEKLCSDTPELLPELKRLIKGSRGMTWVGKPIEEISPRSFQPGELIGRYELVEQIGEGGFAYVWKARDPELKRFVAIKIPKAKIAGFQADSFLEEARKAAQLDHDGIVPVLDVGRTDEQVFIVSKLFEAGSLATRIKETPLSVEESTRLIKLIAEALFHAHQHGFVHRDIKPHNILLDDKGHPKITDFGIALSETQSVFERSRSAGTLAYMSPEQVANRISEIDARTDIYSLGVVFYQLLTSRLPFLQKESMEAWGDVIALAPRTPRTINPSIPIELERICLKAMAKTPNDRYSTALDLAEDLERFMSREIQAKGLKQARSSNSLVLLAFLLIAVITIGYVAWQSNKSEKLAENGNQSKPAKVVDELKNVANVNQPKDRNEHLAEQSKLAAKSVDRITESVGRATSQLDDLQKRISTLPALATPTKSEDDTSAELAVQLGNRALNESRYDTALEEFNKAIDFNEKNAAAWHGRGVTKFNQGQFNDAVADLRKAVKLDSQKPEYYKNLAFALSKAGSHDEAVSMILNGQSRTTLDERAKYNRFVSQVYDDRAAARSQSGYQSGAVADLNEALRWDDTNPMAYHDRGALRFNSREFEKAAEDFSSAINLAPDEKKFYVNRGHALKALGRESDAQADYEMARKLEKATGK